MPIGIKSRLQTKLEKYAGKWLKELPSVVWGLRTQVNASTGRSPFFLVYGAEAVLPSDVQFGSMRVVNYDEDQSEAARAMEIDLLEAERDHASYRSVQYLQALRRYKSCNVRSQAFVEGDLVLRKNHSHTDHHKLSPQWEGPYIVTEVCRPGAYRLMREDGTMEPYTWNIDRLRRYYP